MSRTDNWYGYTVTHLSTNRARRWLTSLIEANALPLRQATTCLRIIVEDSRLHRILSSMYE